MWWLIPPSLISLAILLPGFPPINTYANWVDWSQSAALVVGGWMLILYGHFTA